MFFLPLVNVQKIKSYISRMFYSPMMAQTSIPEGVCPVCRSDPIQTPYIANCGHIFCYYCLKQNCMLDAQYPCPRCGVKVQQLKRIQVEDK
jgi:peroxin-2